MKELKQILTANFVDFTGCCEKQELLERVRLLWKSKYMSRSKGNFVMSSFLILCTGYMLVSIWKGETTKIKMVLTATAATFNPIHPGLFEDASALRGGGRGAESAHGL